VTSIAIALLIFAGSLAAALLAVALQLPRHHLDDCSRDVVKSVMGLVATLAALVLGLLIASANSSYQTLSNQLDQMAASLVELDRALKYYGPEAAPARASFHRVARAEIDRVWPHGQAQLAGIEPGAIRQQSDEFVRIIGRLSPQTEAQRFEQKRILQLVTDFARMRTLMISEAESDLPSPFLAVLMFWLTVLFFGFGLFARLNATVLVALSIGALSVAGAIYLILELSHPFDGLMRISAAPLREALSQMGD